MLVSNVIRMNQTEEGEPLLLPNLFTLKQRRNSICFQKEDEGRKRNQRFLQADAVNTVHLYDAIIIYGSPNRFFCLSFFSPSDDLYSIRIIIKFFFFPYRLFSNREGQRGGPVLYCVALIEDGSLM